MENATHIATDYSNSIFVLLFLRSKYLLLPLNFCTNLPSKKYYISLPKFLLLA